jgi:uncharacterized protein (DUF1499 family)
MRQPPPMRLAPLARWSRRMAIVAGVVALLAIAAIRLGMVTTAEALAMVGAAVAIALTAVLLAGAGFVRIWRAGERGVAPGLVGLVLGLAVLAYPGWLAVSAIENPPINDISTDVETAPVFSDRDSAVYERGGYRPAAYQTIFAPVQRAVHPAVQPLVIDLAPEEAFSAAEKAFTDLGIRITESLPPGEDSATPAILEGVARSPLLRLTDDVVIRIQPLPGDLTRIDIRSASRIGRHDLGVNAARVLRLLDDITAFAENRG